MVGAAIAKWLIKAVVAVSVFALINAINKYSGKTVYPVSQQILAIVLAAIIPIAGIILFIALSVKLLIVCLKRPKEK
ncbi:MAG: hypothetical protein LBB59_04375 [Campylobacteraceae bacterium]|jgi:hypothetical protein|nr:hypothetical protein [Campylobacteraceae bacterium]